MHFAIESTIKDSSYSNLSTNPTEGRWFHYLEEYTNNFNIFNCPKMNLLLPVYQVSNVTGANIGGWPSSWGVMPRGRSKVGGASGYAYNTLNVGGTGTGKRFSQLERIAQRCNKKPDANQIVAVMDGTSNVYDTELGGGSASVFNISRHYIHHNRTNVLFPDGHAASKSRHDFMPCQGVTLSSSPWRLLFAE